MQSKHAQFRRLLSGVLSAAMVMGSVMTASAETAGTSAGSEAVSTESSSAASTDSSTDVIKPTGSNAPTAPDSSIATASNAAYVLMNIPYHEFYAAELNNDVELDGFSSATKNKTRTGSLAGGSYHVDEDGSKIDGVTFPVLVGDGVDLEELGYKQVTDEDSVEITVTNRGTTSTTTYTGKDALFENEDHAYYVLGETPDFYKELQVEDGEVSFGKTVGDVETLSGAAAELSMASKYGDYQISISGLPDEVSTVYGVILSTDDGADYGLCHVANIWRLENLAWSVGFVTTTHNCELQWDHYEAIMGQTINKITYYTDCGIYEIETDTYVPVKKDLAVAVADAADTDEKTTVAFTTYDGENAASLPDDFDAEYYLDGEAVSVENGVLSLEGLEAGTHTLAVKDANGVYADISAEFTVSAADVYVLMNIPYADFYKAELNNSVELDGFSSATLNKPRTGSLAGGSYHVNSDGSKIDGITFPVKICDGVDLSSYKQVTDTDSLDITVTNRGTASTTTYTSKDALFENEDYAYYILTDVPAYYKEATVDGNGSLVFGKVVGDIETLDGSAELATESSYGDYQLTVTADTLTDATVFAVILGTEEGSSYGLRHIENIWRVTNLAWSTGFVTTTHGCDLKWEHYEAIMGQTISTITYYTDGGIYELQVSLYVPVKFDGSVSVKDASIDAGETAVTVEGLPEDFDAEYSVDGLEASVSGGMLTFADAEKGQYTLVISDKSGKYADLSADFILYTEKIPVTYSLNGGVPALITAEDATDEEAADYIANITSVSVDGTEYAATGRGAVVLINEDGTLNLSADAFAGDGAHVVVVTSTGYLKLTFTYDPAAGDDTDDTVTPSVDSDNDSDEESGSDSGSGSGSTASSVGGSGGEPESGSWVTVMLANGQIGWKYQVKNSDTDMYVNNWGYIRNPYAPAGQDSYGWFRFDADGVMLTGWFTDVDGHVYYLNPLTDGCQGMMLTGWQMIDGRWYFLCNWEGAPYGSLLRNARTPDGFMVDENGVWDGGPKAK